MKASHQKAANEPRLLQGVWEQDVGMLTTSIACATDETSSEKLCSASRPRIHCHQRNSTVESLNLARVGRAIDNIAISLYCQIKFHTQQYGLNLAN